MDEIIAKLKGGDLRSIGRVEEVVSDILRDFSLFPDVFKAMSDEDPVVRMRAADASEKVSRVCPQYLQPFKDQLLDGISKIEQQEVRWHLAQMLPRLVLEKNEILRTTNLLISWLDNSKSNIVRVNSLQAIADIANKYPDYRSLVTVKIEEVLSSGNPALKSRGKKLMGLLKSWNKAAEINSTCNDYDSECETVKTK